MSLALMAIISFSNAQGPAIGFWRDHLPYDNIVAVEKDGSVFYAATPYSIFTYDLSDNSIEKLNKGIEISDIGISSMSYNDQESTVVVGYSNGNVDLIKGKQTTNIPAIKTASVSGDKQIYSIHCVDNWAYLATGFGIVKLDLDKEEVKDTYIVGDGGTYAKVYDVATDDTMIYAALDDGIKEAQLSNSFLSDFSQWTDKTGLPLNWPVSQLHEFNGKLYGSFQGSGFADDSTYAFDGSTWILDTIQAGRDVLKIRDDNNRLIIAQHSTVARLSDVNVEEELLFNYGGNAFLSHDAYFDGSITWIASEFKGLIRAESNWQVSSVSPRGPLYTENYSMTTNDDGDIWVAGGSLYGNLGTSAYESQGVYRFKHEYWATYNKHTLPGSLFDSTGGFDFTYVALDPSDPAHVFVSSNSELGLMEMQDGTPIQLYNKSNSSLQERTSFTDVYDISQCHFDDDGNMWVVSSRSTSPLSVKTTDGSWEAFSCSSLSSIVRLTNSILTDDGLLFAAAINTGLWVYNNSETPEGSDDQCRMLTTSMGSGGLPVNQVNCVAEDLDGEIWIGTESGPAVIYSPSNIFGSGDFDAQQILIEQDGNIQVLLETEAITCIAIDGANRKWFGTRGSGVYLISEDGTDQVLHFTEENSPLLSNEIMSIAINGNTGEVFFGTLNGIISYKGTATDGDDRLSSVYAYPNPVSPGYDGTIAIKGLARDSDVKITDVSGNLVYETTSTGGQATWDGRTYDGMKVKSGVYLVFASSEDGSFAAATKIAIVN